MRSNVSFPKRGHGQHDRPSKRGGMGLGLGADDDECDDDDDDGGNQVTLCDMLEAAGLLEVMLSYINRNLDTPQEGMLRQMLGRPSGQTQKEKKKSILSSIPISSHEEDETETESKTSGNALSETQYDKLAEYVKKLGELAVASKADEDELKDDTKKLSNNEFGAVALLFEDTDNADKGLITAAKKARVDLEDNVNRFQKYVEQKTGRSDHAVAYLEKWRGAKVRKLLFFSLATK